MTRVALAIAIVLLAMSSASVLEPAAASNCTMRTNPTEDRLLSCIQTDALWRHLKAFQKIADENPGAQGHGNRNTGTSGYRASVAYVARLMREAGYEVTIQKYPWQKFEVLGAPEFAIDGKRVPKRDWTVARLSGSGSVAAQVEALPLDSGGCAADEFRGFVRGRIALLLPGACDLDLQVTNAEAAGATAIILYNDPADAMAPMGGKGHTDGRAYQAMLASPAGIPVIGVVSHRLGAELVALYRSGHAPRMRISVHTARKSATDYNVIADSPHGDPNHVLVLDAHLDSIHGAGILDNASGSATILEIALNLAHTPTRNQLRYIWFGGEEIALLGSRYYTSTLPRRERRKIAFDIDVDVTATPNFDVLIADPGHAHNVKKFPANVVPESQIGNEAFIHYFNSVGIASRIARFGNDDTDSNPFSRVGIPNSGILTQQDCCKKNWEVGIWGGYLGNYEGKVPGRNGGCVDQPGRWCDNLSNNDPFVLTFVSKAAAAVTLKLANHHFVNRY
jgi:Zn-dependent M28 family amino/carboxypeptidase